MKRITNALRDFLTLSIMAAVVTWVAYNGGRIEGRIFPVMVDSVFTVEEDEDPFHIRVYGDLNKVRDCNFQNMEFFIGGPTEARVASTYIGPTKARSEGEFQTRGYWLVQMDKETFERRGVVRANHDCPNTPWLVVTRMK